MIEHDSDTLRKVAWAEICPWLIIFKVFRLAIGGRVLLMAALAILITLAGWSMLGSFFDVGPEIDAWLRPADGCPWVALESHVPDYPAVPSVSTAANPAGMITSGRDGVFGPWVQLTRPLLAAMSSDRTLSDVGCLLLCALWSLATWAFFGAAITRIAVVQLAAEERVGLAASLRFACSKWLSFFAAPLFPMGGVVLAGIPVFILGLLMRAEVGLLLSAVVWPLAIVAALFMAVLLLGLIFGWPLMWGTVSAEGTDTFDALSRSYAYVFQRPLHYLFYAVVASIIGYLGWLLVSNFAAGVVFLSYYVAGWGAGGIELAPGAEGLGSLGYAGAVLIRVWTGCVKILAVGYLYSYFWTATAAIYLLLRRNVDATELDEVYLDEDASEESYGLPPLKTDEAGAPVVDETAATETPVAETPDEKPADDGEDSSADKA